MRKFLTVTVCIMISLSSFFGCADKLSSVETISEEKIQITKVNLDSVVFTASFSGLGNMVVYKDTIFLFDKIFGLIYSFDINKNSIQRKLGIGKGPYELESGHRHGILPNGNHIFMSDYGFWSYSPHYEKKSQIILDWQCRGKNMRDLESRPDPESVCTYGYKWESSSGIPPFTSLSDSVGIIPVAFEHPKMNAFQHLAYYKETYLFGFVNLQTGVVQKLFAKRPKSLIEKGLIPNFDFADCVIMNNQTIVVTHATEDLMDVYSKEGTLNLRFGKQGSNMQVNYPKAIGNEDYETVEARGEAERSKFGYYYNIYYDREKNVLLRNYYKGYINGKPLWGIQFYNDNFVLIGDVEVPVGLKIVGRIGASYIASGFLTKEDTNPTVYMITLNNKPI